MGPLDKCKSCEEKSAELLRLNKRIAELELLLAQSVHAKVSVGAISNPEKKSVAVKTSAPLIAPLQKETAQHAPPQIPVQTQYDDPEYAAKVFFRNMAPS